MSITYIIIHNVHIYLDTPNVYPIGMPFHCWIRHQGPAATWTCLPVGTLSWRPSRMELWCGPRVQPMCGAWQGNGRAWQGMAG